MKVAVIFDNFGPYHIARLSALAKRCDLGVIEGSVRSSIYEWEPTSDDVGALWKTTLSTEEPIEGLSARATRCLTEKALDTFQPDVVAVPGWASRLAISTLGWCKTNNVPAILMSESSCHDESRSWEKEWAKSRLVRLFSSAIVGGDPHIEYAAKLGMPRERIACGYDVVDNDHFSAGAERARTRAKEVRGELGMPEKFFLSSNRFVEKKNILRMLDAYAGYVGRAKQQPWALVLLGDGELRSNIEDRIINLGLTDLVHLPGFKQYNQLPLYYGLASAFVHASTAEQWGLVVNEAMASGLAVLVSERCGCAPNLVKGGVNGFTFNPFDREEMARLMLTMAHGGADLDAMGKASAGIISNWGPQRFADGLAEAVGMACSAQVKRAGPMDRLLLRVLSHR